MFTGEQTQKMDTKGRTVIPSKIRDNLAERLVVTRGIDKCLFAYPETENSMKISEIMLYLL